MKLAAERRDAEDLARLQDCLARMQHTFETAHEDNLEADVEFHGAIALAAHNVILLALMEPVIHIFRAVLRTIGRMPREMWYAEGLPQPPRGMADWVTWSQATHEEIYQTIARGDAKSA